MAAANQARMAANKADRIAERDAADEKRSKALQRKRDEDARTLASNKRHLDNPIDVDDTSFGADRGKHLSSSAAKRALRDARLHQLATGETPPVLKPLPPNASKQQRRQYNRRKKAFA